MSMEIHPMIVHFPIALVITGFLFATIALFCKRCSCSVGQAPSDKASCVSKVGYWMLALGTLGAIGAVLSGFFFTSDMTGPMERILNTHQLLAISTLIVGFIASGVYTYYIYKARLKPVEYIGYALYFATVVLVSITGHYGGTMVYMFK